MPKVTVQIVTYNSQSYIESCLHSVNGQKFQDFDVIVVDNASDDQTVEIVRDLGYAVTILNENIGFAAGHNFALQKSDGDYVLVLNPDVILSPDFLETLVHALDENPDWGSASGCLWRIDTPQQSPQRIDSAGLEMQRNRRQILRFHGKPVESAPVEIEEIWGPDGAAAFCRRKMLNDIAVFGEVFDADFFMHKEDVDLCWRAQLRGWKSFFVPAAVAYHIRTFRPGVGQRNMLPSDLKFYATRNRYFLMLKNEIPAHFLWDFVFILIYEIFIWGYILIFERESLRMLGSLWQHRHQMLKKRRYIQAHRTATWQDMRRWFQ